MNKPNVSDILEIVQMKAEATALYEKIDKRTAEIMTEFGAGRFDYDLNQAAKNNYHPVVDELLEKGQYLKFQLEDNIKKLQSGGAVWKSVGFKPVSFSSSSLKRCPESLK